MQNIKIQTWKHYRFIYKFTQFLKKKKKKKVHVSFRRSSTLEQYGSTGIKRHSMGNPNGGFKSSTRLPHKGGRSHFTDSQVENES